MALTDINFQEGDGRDFIVEISAGTLNAPVDILDESGGNYLVSEIEGQAGTGDIFIVGD